SAFCVLSFLLIPPPPPTSTLFPYTTLFRSRAVRIVRRRCRGGRAARPAARRQEAAQDGRGRRRLWRRRGGRRACLSRLPGLAAGDRKSTRLNSSHQIISYAVFCLKKKNKHL